KNDEAEEGILPQALGYAVWAESNPDSIKAIWIESKTKPERISIDWDNIDIRIILIAPSFKLSLSRMARKIGYEIDLLKIQRYSSAENEFILVESLEDVSPKATTTKAMTAWTWEYYESEHGKEATSEVRRIVDIIGFHVKKVGWNLPHNLNKYYIGFKL